MSNLNIETNTLPEMKVVRGSLAVNHRILNIGQAGWLRMARNGRRLHTVAFVSRQSQNLNLLCWTDS